MNQTIHEQLSALMDGELERDQTRFLLKRMASEHELPQRWARYHLVRQTLRRQEMPSLSVDFAELVMTRIDAEPAARAHTQPVWLRWGAGGAIAASVAIAALVLTQPPSDGPGRATLASGNPLPRAVAPQTATTVAAAPVAATSATPPMADFRPPMLAPNLPVETAPVNFGSDLSQSIALDPRMQSYLIRHYQTPGATGQTAFVPYVLLVSPQRDAAQPGPQNR